MAFQSLNLLVGTFCRNPSAKTKVFLLIKGLKGGIAVKLMADTFFLTKAIVHWRLKCNPVHVRMLQYWNKGLAEI